MTQATETMPEAVRLVIWDLDETFWQGTLCEGGIKPRAAALRAVATLARRGIVSSICSKNDMIPVEAALRRQEVWDYFVFPDVSWAAKGPRLKALIEAFQLRPPSVLFIDDNPQNLAEAQYFLPGLQVADTAIVDSLLDDDRLSGNPDPSMTRLAQYRLLATRSAAREQSTGDTTTFLRESGITVSIENDVMADLDRAIELILRTNQLNFTKQRLPVDPARAREVLIRELGHFRNQAGLVRVSDRYGDYGVCGLYMVHNSALETKSLKHFCFSCRILGMGIETWLYRNLGRPELDIKGEVGSDPIGDIRDIDWITLELPGIAKQAPDLPRPLDYVLARGACDIRAISHYFHMTADTVIEELNRIEEGRSILVNSILMAAQAIKGYHPESAHHLKPFGFRAEDFETLIANPPLGRRGIWVMSLVTENADVFRHRATGTLMPLKLGKFSAPPGPLTDPAAIGLPMELATMLASQFDYVGPMPDKLFSEALALVLAQATPDIHVFILLDNEKFRDDKGNWRTNSWAKRRNHLIRRAAKKKHAVELLHPAKFMSAEELATLTKRDHFTRLVYYRIFEHIMSRVSDLHPAHGSATGRQSTFAASTGSKLRAGLVKTNTIVAEPTTLKAR